MALISGTRLGPYEIVAPLGAGGMGEVYRARDTRLGRDVAVKVLVEHLLATPEARARFEREAKTASRLSHPHICVLHDMGRDGDTDYLVMELVEGETLSVHIAKGPLPPRDVARLGAQVASALDRAHRAGVVHRDLKPGNIMLTKSGAKLMDFGIARAMAAAERPAGADRTRTVKRESVQEPITAAGTVVGTIQYMAPEQLEGKGADGRSDIWALGCVLYEAATGRRAFEGSSPASIISAVLRDNPRVMAELAPMTPPALERAVRQCLAKDADERWQSAGDLSRELLWIAEDGSRARATVTPAADSLAERPGRARAAWILATLFAVATLAASYVAWRANEQAGRHFTFTRLTFKPMGIFAAAFAPDEKTVIFTGVTSGQPRQTFVKRPESPELRPIGDPGMRLLAVSSKGELAVDTGGGTLARMPMGGAGPRALTENVLSADWSPDGTQLAIVREIGARVRIEYPIGTVLAESTGAMSNLRISPQGDLIAYFYHPNRGDSGGSVHIVDTRGIRKRLTDDYADLVGLAWAKDGKEILFSAGDGNSSTKIFSVTPKGRRHVVLETGGSARIFDVSRDGRWLTAIYERRDAIMVHKPEWSQDRDFSWLDASGNGTLTRDGSILAFTDWGEAAGSHGTMCLQRLDGSQVTILGEGGVISISPDGKWVLSWGPSKETPFVAYPIGPGHPREIGQGLRDKSYERAWWSFRSDSVIFTGSERGRGSRFYIQALAGGPPRAVTPEGVGRGMPARDSSCVLVAGSDGRFSIYPRAGGSPQPVRGLSADDQLLCWWARGRMALVGDWNRSFGVAVRRIDLTTGRRTQAFEVVPPIRDGAQSVNNLWIADDARAYTYTIMRVVSTLYVVSPEN